MEQSYIRIGWLSALVALAFLASAMAQAATLNVTVSDAQTGAQLDNITIAVVPQTGDSREGVTDAMGQAQFEELPAGIYAVSASSLSYADKVVSNVELQGDETKSVEIALFSRVIQLDQVSVTTSRRQEKVLEAPASVSVLDDSQIRARAALTPMEHFKSLAAVDTFNTGISQGNVTVRGFSNVLSSSLLSLVDNRIASVPSLRVNAYTLVSTPDNDIDQIEVVSGPGSALYGPNSANGVIHILTKSPFGSEGTEVSLATGERGVFVGSCRHAGSINNKLGYKLTGTYTQGEDWHFTDPTEQQLRRQQINAGVPEDDVRVGARNFDMEQRRLEARVDYRVSDDLTAIFNGGYTQATGIELTGIGAAQATGWTYRYLQARALYKDVFAQAFLNKSNAGDTFLLREGSPLVDRSTLLVGQLQHGVALGTRQRLTYGVDMLLTRPNTDGTINGANEEDDNINEIGVYVQSETDLTDKLRLVAATRFDKHNRLEGTVFSPRAALVFQPFSDHNVRATYNRAFTTPTTNNLFVDVRAAEDAFGLGALFSPTLGFSPSTDIRAQGVPQEGFHFSRSANGRPRFRSPFAPLARMASNDYIDLDNPQFTNVMWSVARGAVINGFVSEIQKGLGALGVPDAEIQVQVGLLSQVLDAAVPQQISDVKNVMRTIDLETLEFAEVDDVFDVDRLEPTITQTFEIGYKGTLFNRLLVGVDAYHTKIRNFIGSIAAETPNVFLDPSTLSASLGKQIAAKLSDPQNAAANAALIAALDTNPLAGGNGNGSAADELTTLFAQGAAAIPFGTVSPVESEYPTAVTTTYRNFGELSVNGLDFKFAYFLNENWNLGGTYSLVSEDLFEKVDGLRDIALNAPRNKFGVSVEYLNSNLNNLTAQLRLRFVDAFPVDSGVYRGTVERYTTIDLNTGYSLPFSSNTRVSLAVQNLLNNKHQEFVGVPEIGRLSLLRITQSL